MVVLSLTAKLTIVNIIVIRNKAMKEQTQITQPHPSKVRLKTSIERFGKVVKEVHTTQTKNHGKVMGTVNTTIAVSGGVVRALFMSPKTIKKVLGNKA